MKKLILAAALLAVPALASAQECETYDTETGGFTVQTCPVSDDPEQNTKVIQHSFCADEAGEMVCSEPVAITVPARPASTPDWELDNRAIGLVCHQRVGDEATIYCGHQFGNLWGPISINLCRWQEDGSRTCKTTVSEPHNPL